MSIELSLQTFLTQVPTARQSLNHLVFGYWIRVDGYGGKQKDFRQTTSVESLLREYRNLIRRRPDLSVESYAHEHKKGEFFEELFAPIKEAFPGVTHV